MQTQEAQHWEDLRRFRGSADRVADLGYDCVQINEEKEETEREDARPRNGIQAPRGCLPGCHVVLLKGDFLATWRE
jgi:hypothetical protein